MSQRLVVFVSSTVEDLDDVRHSIRDALESRGIDVRLSEDPDFPVEPGVTSHDACLRAVRNAHVFVLLIGSRFGGEYQRQNKSITWREWEEAMDAKLIPIVLVAAETNALAREIYKRRVALQAEHPDEQVVEIDARLRSEERFADRKPDRHNLPGVQRFIDAVRKGHVDNWVHLDWNGSADDAQPRIDARLTSTLAVLQRRHRAARDASERARLRTDGLSEISSVAASLAAEMRAGRATLESGVERFLSWMESYREPLLSFRPSDRHNFVVYLRDGDTLRPVCRRSHPSVPTHGREWKIGQGHVGLSVERNRMMVSGDIRHTEAWVPKEAHRTDGLNYVSAISVPFTFVANDDGPDGALIVTSSRLDHFASATQVEVLTVGMLTNMLTVLYSVGAER